MNGGAAFTPALRSILRQTYTNWELLLCDDGSRDGSLELARSLQDPRVVVWSDGKTKGLAARLNECLAKASGSLIARMDADDISYPARLERQVTYLQAHPDIDLVGCRMLICGEDNSALGTRPLPTNHAAIVAHPATGFELAHPTWMARAAWYRRHQYDPTALRFEDVELLYRAYPTSHFANLPEILYGYREMPGGFRKRLKTRLGRVRYLRAHPSENFPRAALVEAAKVAADALICATGTRYAMLRRRENPLSSAELAEWKNLLLELTERPATPSLAKVAQA
ncbi:MAG: glycosyltransferase family 2 protein [Bryobacteraceae bacterium]|nr:glycosyltransferase family 2 protein [Bryobacteraceae bacterium]